MSNHQNKFAAMLKPGLILLLVACVAALVLGLVNAATEGPIAVNAEEKMNRAMQSVLPAEEYTDLEAGSIEALKEIYAADGVGLNAVYSAKDVGWVVQVTESGSQGLVTMMVGVDKEFKCTGISVTKSSETAGLGAIAGQASTKGELFRGQFVGQSGTVAVTKDGGEIDAIAGATITSKAVCRGVTKALNACEALEDSSVSVITSASPKEEEAEPAEAPEEETAEPAEAPEEETAEPADATEEETAEPAEAPEEETAEPAEADGEDVAEPAGNAEEDAATGASIKEETSDPAEAAEPAEEVHE